MKRLNWTRVISGLGAVLCAAHAMAEWQPGLKGGSLPGYMNLTDFPAVTNSYTKPHAAATQSKPPWADSTTWVYWGQMYFNGGTYHFAENIDDAAYLKINDVVYINNSIWNSPTQSGPVNLPVGWHDIEMRFGNGSGGAGPVVGNGWTSTKGFGYNIDGSDTNQGGDYVFPDDNGTMTLFRHDDGTAFTNPEATTLSAVDVGFEDAKLVGGLISTGTSETALFLYWGRADGGEDAAAWENMEVLADAPAIPGIYTNMLVGLLAMETIYYRAAASNESGLVFSPKTVSFTTPSRSPEVRNGAATDVLDTSAEISGMLVYEGVPPTRLYAFWATTDCGADAAAWLDSGASADLGEVAEGMDETVAIAGLAPNTTYYYSFMASNAYGMAWGTQGVSSSFRTHGTPGIMDEGVNWVSDSTAKLGGALVDGTEAHVYLVWGTSAETMTNTNDLGVIPMRQFEVELTGLEAATAYHYQLHAENVYGTAASPVASFNTLALVALRTTGSSGAWTDPSIWNPAGVPQAGTEVVINTDHNVTLDVATPSLLSAAVYGVLTFDAWGAKLAASEVTIAGTVTHVANSATAAVGGEWIPNARVFISCDNLAIASGGKIDVAEKGYAGSPGWPTAGRGPGGGIPYIGGGHGGFGGGFANASGGTYGLAENPLQPGSGGGEGNGAKGGHGGGAVLVQASGTVIVNGTVIADGGRSNGGGGSGGSIQIECDRIAGTGGILSANGGQSPHANGASGGGGRIAIKYNVEEQGMVQLPQLVFSTAAGDTLNTAKVGDVGTLYFPDNQFLDREVGTIRHSGQWIAEGLTQWTAGTLSMSNAWLRLSSVGVTVSGAISVTGTSANIHRLEMSNAVLSCDGDLSISKGSLRLYGGEANIGGGVLQDGGGIWLRAAAESGSALSSGGDLLLTNGASMTVYSCPSNTTWPVYGGLVDVAGDFVLADGSWVYPWSDSINGGSAMFRASNMSVSANAGFDASGKGYAGSKSYSVVGSGPGGGASRVGGGHGGTGGRYTGTTGKSYGSDITPTLPGSGGGEGNGGYGGNGGGAIWLQAAGRIVMNGALLADGTESKGGGGSGGSIMIDSGMFSGGSDAVMTAAGGSALHEAGAGGGGGRIAVWHNVPESYRAAILAGNMKGVEISSEYGKYQGVVSAAAGTGVNPQAQPGTIVFLTVPPPAETVLIVR